MTCVRVHILGIGGTFMGGLAVLGRELGLNIEGSDQNIYPPMSTQLEALAIPFKTGYQEAHLQPPPDLTLVGNALSRGNPAVEHLLNHDLKFQSGPQWLHDNVLMNRRVIAVAGTHGKTTTTSMLAWILQSAGRSPGFLVGGVPNNFGISARLGQGRDFVIEADEYDTAFFDKRSKFLHYKPHIAVLNNLEFDHADIFPDIAAIARQFHHLVRIVPSSGALIVNAEDKHLADMLAMGCWTPIQRFAIDRHDVEWRAELITADASRFNVYQHGVYAGQVEWSLLGRHNAMNALAAIAAAYAADVSVKDAIRALAAFSNVQRRLQLLGCENHISIYDDFAHHPTAIATTLEGLRARVGAARIVVAFEPRSNSMRAGAHAADLAHAFNHADHVVLLQRPELAWDAQHVMTSLLGRGITQPNVESLVVYLKTFLRANDHVVFMSNGGFDNAPLRLLSQLKSNANI
jgi:UDP-N-acetylmuramate: L-alanyl-gamma-D-glutamyl-meso-diaminopimelate ligase